MVENVLWPAYLDATKTRGEGRRVPRAIAIENPTVEEIAAAVEQIGYEAVVDRDKTYPRELEPRGRVRVKDVEDAKNDLIQAVAAYLSAMRD